MDVVLSSNLHRVVVGLKWFSGRGFTLNNISTSKQESPSILHSYRFFQTAPAPPPPPPSSSSVPLKDYSSIPGPNWIELLRAFRDPINITIKPFALWIETRRLYGDIVKFKLLKNRMVMSFDPSSWEHIYRSSEKIPTPLSLYPLLERERRLAMKDKNYRKTPISLENEEWRQNRSILDKKFMVISQIQKYMSSFNVIADDMCRIIQNNLDKEGNLPNLENLFYAYSTEGIGSVVFGYRLNVLAEVIPQEARDLLSDLQKTFSLMSKLLLSIPWYYYFPTPTWKRFNSSMDSLERRCLYYAEKAEEFNKNNKERVDLTHFMRQEGLSEEACLRNSITMFFVGADSTTNSMLWLIHNLGRFPEVQEKLRQELNTHLPRGEPITPSVLKNLKYLKNTIKESMRLTPVLHGISRTFDKEITLNDYKIPANTTVIMIQYVVNKDEKYFPDPYNFRPERWEEGVHPLQKWIHLPFGFGPRMCQGFRVSELEMFILCAKLVQNFKWRTLEEATPIIETFIKPEHPLKICWEKI